MNINKLGVLIATSMDRRGLLYNRSLKSVLQQSRKADFILIVDDNNNDLVFDDIENYVSTLNNTSLFCIKNRHTKHMSGSGAWNSGIDWYSKIFSKNDYIAILDDDDSWDIDYLKCCEDEIKNSQNIPYAIFAYLKRSDCENESCFKFKDISVNSFLIGNPGIQGSNMVFRYDVLQSIGGFDENLASCTDRDLMIRFLIKYPERNIKIIPKVLVNHFVSSVSVTCNSQKKEDGLNSFYSKFISLYSEDELKASLARSKKLFGYRNENILKLYNLLNTYSCEDKIVIGVAVHNNAATIRRCLVSILEQRNLKRKLWVLIVDDDSNDNWEKDVKDLLSNYRLISMKIKNNNIAKTRNYINGFIRKYYSNVSLIGRLDSDDEYAGNKVVSEIELTYDMTGADVVFAGNYLRYGNKILDRINKASKDLRNPEYLIERIRQMSENIKEAELPSCNTFINVKVEDEYPDIPSAEDHFFCTRLLLNKRNLKIEIAENTLLTIYNLSGSATAGNKKNEKYLSARKELLAEAENLWKMMKEN